MEASVRKTDRVIVQYGNGLGERADSDVVTLSKATEAALLIAVDAPNGGIVLNVDGTLATIAKPAPAPDPNAAAKARLAQLRAKGWAAMTVLEKDEASGILFALGLAGG